MVALHNKRLTHTDLFRGVLWTDTEWHAMRDKFIAELRAEGVEMPELFFRASRMMEDYQRSQPSMKERQQIAGRIYPPRPAPSRIALSEEEIDWLAERLDGVNEPVGQDILAKLRALQDRRRDR